MPITTPSALRHRPSIAKSAIAPPGHAYENCRCDEGEWRIGKREVAIRQIACGDARGVLEDVARVPQNREAKMLNNDDSSARGSKKNGYNRIDVVTKMSPVGCYDFG